MAGQEPEPNQTETPPEPTEPTTEPQQTFDADYVKKLRAEAAQHRKAAKEAQTQLSDLQKAQDAAEAKKLEEQGAYQELAKKAQAEAEQLRQELEAQAKRLTDEKRNRLAISVATRLGAIDPTDANFISAVAGIDAEGDDAEAAILSRLEALKDTRPYLFQGHRPTPALTQFNPGHGPQPQPRETDQQRRDRIYGGGVGIFDPQTAQEHGGGVVFRDNTRKTE